MSPIDGIQHAKAGLGLAVTAGTISAAWLADIEAALRIVLTLIGCISGLYAALYYRLLWKEKKARNGTHP